jgi:hypothetical protein
MSALPRADLMLQLIDEVRGLRAEVRALLGARRPPPDAAGEALLRAIHDHVRERPFTCFDLVDHVEVANAEKLGAAIMAACGALSPRRVGRLLRSIEGEPLEGLRVVRVGISRAGILWQLKADASLQVSKLAKPGAFA